ncbi:2Fe-2S iron-sulfur cluster-binding protein [Marinomonas sp. 2405UD68-3]|uniref:2Fe-2S iron-sulfur cluster-binding protein n=1 Tax=Marinomonas sp. 2405UD68-3 TaxID=3391835 RepID=UPI0039C94DB8
MNKCTYSFNNSTQGTIQISPEKTLLDALSENTLPMKKACINGACGTCLMQLVEGEVDYNGRVPRGLNSKEIDTGHILPCIARCKSDVVIRAISPRK